MTIRLSDKAWSPYVAGVIIGLLQIPAFMLIGTALGASSSYVTVSAHMAGMVDQGVASIDYAVKHMQGAKNWWQVALVVGVAWGAFLSARTSGMRRSGFSPVWQRVLGARSSALRFPMAFIGGFLMLMGARIADGCTSGHGLSGIAQLSIGSFIAVAAMFAGAIATAMLMRRI